jgi:hypothetical protein
LPLQQCQQVLQALHCNTFVKKLDFHRFGERIYDDYTAWVSNMLQHKTVLTDLCFDSCNFYFFAASLLFDALANTGISA